MHAGQEAKMENFDYPEICRRVREIAQTEKKWTHFDLSKKSGVSYRTVSSIMRGVARPQNSVIRKIASALGVTPEQIGATGLEPGPAIVSETRERYGSDEEDRADVTVYQAVGILSDATQIEEDKILQFVIDNMPRRERMKGEG
jgi:transcriptional regulator with XRE-family HTH domain